MNENSISLRSVFQNVPGVKRTDTMSEASSGMD